MAASLINRSVGPFILRAQIGQGGVAEVFRAEHRSDGRDVAVKVLRADRLVERTRVKAFHDEFTLLRRLDHPAVPKAHQLAELDGRPAIVMDLVPGTALARLASAPGDQLRLRCLRQLVAATAYLHGQRVVHHDLKLENAILRTDGQVVLLDFGSAIQRSLSQVLIASLSRRPHTVFASPTYVAPEVLRGRGGSFASDCYALGVCAWMLLAGRPPIIATDVDERLRSAERGVPSLAESVPGVHASLARAVDACLAPDPDLRLDATQLQRACAAGESVRTSVTPA